MTTTAPDRKLTTAEAAEYLGLAESTLVTDRCTKRLRIPFYKFGKTVRYSEHMLAEWQQAHVVNATETA
ncbi:MAG: helix-turn-helix domain-containing protein [Phycisphaeraceae bacterium]